MKDLYHYLEKAAQDTHDSDSPSFDENYYDGSISIIRTAFDLFVLDTLSFLPPRMVLSVLREKYETHVLVTIETIGSDDYIYAYKIRHLPRKHWGAKRRMQLVEHIESFREGFGTYTGGFDTYEEAEAEGVKKALSIIFKQ